LDTLIDIRVSAFVFHFNEICSKYLLKNFFDAERCFHARRRGLRARQRGFYADERGFHADGRGFHADERGMISVERLINADERNSSAKSEFLQSGMNLSRL